MGGDTVTPLFGLLTRIDYSFDGSEDDIGRLVAYSIASSLINNKIITGSEKELRYQQMRLLYLDLERTIEECNKFGVRSKILGLKNEIDPIIGDIMDPAKQMMEEHRVIERAVDILEKIVEGLEEGIQLPPELILTDIGLIMECMDEFHLEKEESILVSYLDEIGKTDLRNAVQSFLDKYKDSMKYLHAIYDAMEYYEEANLEASSTIIENGRKYIEEVRPLFIKEDETVFKPLSKSLSQDEMDHLEDMFQDFEYSWMGPQLANYQKMVRELERKACLTVW